MEDDAAHYLRRVMRLRAGDRWVALDGVRQAWVCQLLDKTHSERVEDWPAVAPLLPSVTVGLALCKGSRFEDALEKLAELGVSRTVPLRTARTERGLPSPAKAERWKEITRSASALANRLVPMDVAPPNDLFAFLETQECEHTVHCQVGGARPSEVFAQRREAVTLLIGPEGGFSPDELAILNKQTCAMSLGPLTLRVETAAVCAVSLCFGFQ